MGESRERSSRWRRATYLHVRGHSWEGLSVNTLHGGHAFHLRRIAAVDATSCQRKLQVDWTMPG